MRAIPDRESLTVEFKSDRNRLLDRELTSAVVCLADTDGGEIYLGVEDGGTITGLHPDRSNPAALAAMIANRTSPPINVRLSVIEEGMQVVRIEVPRSTKLVATSEGLIQCRRLLADGTPECIPFYPHKFLSRQADLCTLD